MNVHKNAPLTPQGRERMVRQVLAGTRVGHVAAAFDVSVRTVRKWVSRFKMQGVAGLCDVSSRPHTLNRPTAPAVVEEIIRLRRQRLTGQHIARHTGVSPATVSRALDARRAMPFTHSPRTLEDNDVRRRSQTIRHDRTDGVGWRHAWGSVPGLCGENAGTDPEAW